MNLDIHQSPMSHSTLKREEPLHTSVSLVHPTLKFCNGMQFEGLVFYFYLFDIGFSFEDSELVESESFEINWSQTYLRGQVLFFKYFYVG